MWILIMSILTGPTNQMTGNITAEFTSQTTCEEAAKRHIQNMKHGYGLMSPVPTYIVTCTKK